MGRRKSVSTSTGLEIVLDRAFSEGLAVGTLKDLDVLVPVDGWKLQQLMRSESVRNAALGGERVEFLGFQNRNVLEQKSRDVAIGQVVKSNANAFSDGSVVVFSRWNVLALESIVKLCIHVVFDFFEEGFELNVRLDGSDIDRGSIVAAKDVVEGVVKTVSSAVLERDKGSVFDARINSGEHGHAIDAHDVEIKCKWAYFSAQGTRNLCHIWVQT